MNWWSRPASAGAISYLIKPFQRAELVPAIEIAIARFRELAALSEQADSLAEQLESRKLVDRAKGILMDQQGLVRTRCIPVPPADGHDLPNLHEGDRGSGDRGRAAGLSRPEAAAAASPRTVAGVE